MSLNIILEADIKTLSKSLIDIIKEEEKTASKNYCSISSKISINNMI